MLWACAAQYGSQEPYVATESKLAFVHSHRTNNSIEADWWLWEAGLGGGGALPELDAGGSHTTLGMRQMPLNRSV